MSEEKIPRAADAQVDDLPPEAVSGEEADEVTGGGIEPTPFMPVSGNPTLRNPNLGNVNNNLNNTLNR
jgi:hypothetical protein